jgi:hypothetical protein
VRPGRKSAKRRVSGAGEEGEDSGLDARLHRERKAFNLTLVTKVSLERATDDLLTVVEHET